jgi:hypothetical protein
VGPGARDPSRAPSRPTISTAERKNTRPWPLKHPAASIVSLRVKCNAMLRRSAGACAPVLAALVLCTAGSALAARYAAPAGSSSNDCASPATPCDLTTAVQGAENGEGAIVEPGSYTVTKSIAPSARNLKVRGDGQASSTASGHLRLTLAAGRRRK